MRAQTDEIRAFGAKMSVQIVEIGDRLGAVRQLIPHGQWATYLDTELGMSERTANNYLHAAQVATKIKELGKSEIISDLPATVMYLLGESSMPDSVIEDVVGGRCEPTQAAIKAARAMKAFGTRNTVGTTSSPKSGTTVFHEVEQSIAAENAVPASEPTIIDGTAREIPSSPLMDFEAWMKTHEEALTAYQLERAINLQAALEGEDAPSVLED